MNKEQIKDWLAEYKITNYSINDDLVVDVHGNAWIGRANLTSLPFQFGIVQGAFSCSDNKLTSLEYCPKEVHGGFYCDGNQLTSLEHCPKEVKGSFSCSDNKLTSLEHCPKVVQGYFVCDEHLRNDIRYLRWKLAKQLLSL